MSKKLAAFVSAFVLAAVAPASAFAVGGPNEAGKSGHFHPLHQPCDGKNDHPHCPGPR